MAETTERKTRNIAEEIRRRDQAHRRFARRLCLLGPLDQLALLLATPLIAMGIVAWGCILGLLSGTTAIDTLSST